MPFYERKCSECEHRGGASLERMTLTDEEEVIASVCPECGEPTFVRVISASAANFKTLEKQCRGT